MIMMRHNKREQEGHVRTFADATNTGCSSFSSWCTGARRVAPAINSRRFEWDIIELSRVGVSILICTCINATSGGPNESPSHRALEQ